MVRFLDAAAVISLDYVVRNIVLLILILVFLVWGAVCIVNIFIFKKDRSEKLLDKIMEEDEKTQ